MRRVALVCLAICGLFVLAASGMAAPQNYGVPSGSSTPRQFTGDTRNSDSSEARSMSPPHWGEEPTYWKNNAQVTSSNPLAPRVAPKIAPPPASNSQGFFSPASTGKSAQKKSSSSLYQHIIDPAVLNSFPSANTDDQEPTSQSVQPQFHRPQSLEERGFREYGPMNRGMPINNGQSFDFENKKQQYPPMSEIIKTGRFFGMAETWLMRPSFNNNAVLTTQSASFAESFQADHAFRTAPRFRAGFESKYGPGAEFQYFQFDHNSRPIEFVSNGALTGTSSVEVIGLSQPVSISASSPGHRLSVGQAIEVHSFQFTVFKEMKLPISRVNGMLGFRNVSIAQELRTNLFDSGGNSLEFLTSNTKFGGFGPHFGLEYYRPVGHTKLEMFGSASGSLVLGNRSQFVNDSNTFITRRNNADEMVSILEIMTGVQYKYEYAENRSYYARVAYTNQTWLNAGTPNAPLGDLGFRGLGFSVGFNR
ncbi:MAG: Lpg1974 family pore-forming outer membrane protein [Pirellulaceae bacterium]